jgi:hypothetical protein
MKCLLQPLDLYSQYFMFFIIYEWAHKATLFLLKAFPL